MYKRQVQAKKSTERMPWHWEPKKDVTLSLIHISLDGPAGAGKSWLAKTLAAELGYIHVDTGASVSYTHLSIL